MTQLAMDLSQNQTTATSPDSDDGQDTLSESGSSVPSEPTQKTPAKMRIKLKLPIKSNPSPAQENTIESNTTTANTPTLTLPKQDTATDSLPSTANKPKKSIRRGLKLPMSRPSLPEDEAETKATVVDSDDPDQDDTMAIMAPLSIHGTTTSKNAIKRRATHPSRPIRLPAIGSPGLLMPPTSGMQSTQALVAPEEVFAYHMEQAGYTTKNREQRPHRGSSVRRVVGDLFDSNVKLSLHFPPLVPKDLWEEVENGVALPQKVMNMLEPKHTKRRKIMSLRNMIPISLTMPLPESFIQQRLRYVEEVRAREAAIVEQQEAQEEMDMDLDMELDTEQEPKVSVPPIPQEPEPPRLADIPEFPDSDRYEDKAPLYPPKGKEEYVAHLDKDCFHVTDGRYFGLLSNHIADPNFVGPNVPGIAGASNGGGLATAIVTGGSSGSALTLSTTSFQTVPSNPLNSLMMPKTTIKKAEKTPSSHASSPNPETKPLATDGISTDPQLTMSSLKLRKSMDSGDEISDSMKQAIIRAAVHAARTGQHGSSFKLGDDTYSDVSKAFAVYAGVKPCQRCKNNKQGSYHCRLRRRHRDTDYDGGYSSSCLTALFDAPIESLEEPKELKEK